MKNIRHTFLQQRVQQRRSTRSFTPNDTEFKMTPERKEFLEILEKHKRESIETGNRWEGPH